MKRIIQTPLFIFMTLGFLCMLFFVFVVTTIAAKRQARNIISSRLRDLSLDVTEWRESFRKLRSTTDSGALAKVRMLARMIQYDPAILKSDSRLKELASALNVDTIDISDKDGILVASTEPGFLGFRMDSTEQSREFMPAIEDKTFELVQDPQERGIDHVLVQYAGVARLDEPGIVQISYEAGNVFNYSDIELMQSIMQTLPIGKGGRFLVLEDGDDPVVFASGDPSENGCRLSELAFHYDPVLPESLFLRGKPYFCQHVKIPGEPRRVLALMPKDDVFGVRNRAMLFLLVFNFIYFVLLFLLLNHLFKRTVTDGFGEVNRTLDRIIAGDLTQTVNVRSNPEFLALSDGINTMVGGLKKNLTDSKRRVRRENELAKSIQRTLIPPAGPLFPLIPQIDSASTSVLAAHKGGDILETFEAAGWRPGFVMAEAIGDSVAACLSMMKFRAVLQPCAAFSPDPLSLLNKGIELFQDDNVFKKQFISVFVGFFDLDNRRLDYVNAGYYPPFLRRSGGAFEQLRTPPDAVFTTAHPVEYHMESITFEPGDLLFLCSNGVFSYRDADGCLFTRTALLKCLNAPHAENAQELLDGVSTSLRQFSGELPPDDDVIMAAFRMDT